MAGDVGRRGGRRLLQQLLCVLRRQLLRLGVLDASCCHGLFAQTLRHGQLLAPARSVDKGGILAQGCQLEVKIVPVELSLNRVPS